MIANRESGSYRVFSVRDDSGSGPAAGQFYMLAAESRWEGPTGRPYLARAFSVAQAEVIEGGHRLEFLVEPIGPGTDRLAKLEVGEGIWLTGPLGRGFSRPAELVPGAAGAILVGGGIGVAPLAIWQRQLRAAGSPTRILLGFRDPEHHGGTDLFDCSEVRIATDDGHAGTKGRVTDLLAVLLEGDQAAAGPVYACGPPPMLEAVRIMCGEAGVPAELALEAPMACGFGACMGCAIPLASHVGEGYMRLCLDGPVVNAADIETALVRGSGHESATASPASRPGAAV